MRLEYESQEKLDTIAKEVLEFLRTKELPVWQVKDVLGRATRLAEFTIMK